MRTTWLSTDGELTLEIRISCRSTIRSTNARRLRSVPRTPRSFRRSQTRGTFGRVQPEDPLRRVVELDRQVLLASAALTLPGRADLQCTDQHAVVRTLVVVLIDGHDLDLDVEGEALQRAVEALVCLVKEPMVLVCFPFGSQG